MIKSPGWATSALLLVLIGCTSTDNTRSLQEHTADATAAAKRDAGAIARGIAEGLARKGPVDINSASSEQLQRLPGITPDVAGRIIKHRPYTTSRDLLHRHILTTAEYNQIKDQITTQQQ